MQVGIFQLLQAKREQIAAGRLYIDSLRGYWVARTVFEQVLNGWVEGIPGEGTNANLPMQPGRRNGSMESGAPSRGAAH